MTESERGKACMIKPIKATSVPSRRKFDETFKAEAVHNWLSSGKSATVIAQELGLSPERLYAWRRRFGPADAGGGRPPGQNPAPAPISNPSSTRPGAKCGICGSSGTF